LGESEGAVIPFAQGVAIGLYYLWLSAIIYEMKKGCRMAAFFHFQLILHNLPCYYFSVFRLDTDEIDAGG
jgi:hypothetical protein